MSQISPQMPWVGVSPSTWGPSWYWCSSRPECASGCAFGVWGIWGTQLGRWVAFSWSPWGMLGQWYNTDTKSDYVAYEDGFMTLRWGLSINEQVIPLILTSNWVRSPVRLWSSMKQLWFNGCIRTNMDNDSDMFFVFKSPILKTYTHTYIYIYMIFSSSSMYLFIFNTIVIYSICTVIYLMMYVSHISDSSINMVFSIQTGSWWCPVCAPLDHGGAFFLRNDARFDALQDVAYSILPTHGGSAAKIRP